MVEPACAASFNPFNADTHDPRSYGALNVSAPSLFSSNPPTISNAPTSSNTGGKISYSFLFFDDDENGATTIFENHRHSLSPTSSPSFPSPSSIPLPLPHFLYNPLTSYRTTGLGTAGLAVIHPSPP